MKAKRAGDRLQFWCPGCDGPHAVTVEGPHAWGWNGSVDALTLTPSVLVTGGGDKRCCHSFVTNGRIEFLPDCTHSLAGQTVDLPDWPSGW